MNILKSLFIKKSPKKAEKNDFSEFFVNAKSKDKTKIMRHVLREATEQQRAVIKKYEEMKTA